MQNKLIKIAEKYRSKTGRTCGVVLIFNGEERRMNNPNERLVMCNLVGVDKGALTMVKNVLERSGKDEVKDALIDSAVPVEVVLEQMAKDSPALYMKFVTEQMMILYT